jgi:hypothetical protein
VADAAIKANTADLIDNTDEAVDTADSFVEANEANEGSIAL